MLQHLLLANESHWLIHLIIKMPGYVSIGRVCAFFIRSMAGHDVDTDHSFSSSCNRITRAGAASIPITAIGAATRV